MNEFILEMNHISKIYGNGIVANKDVDFSLKEGEIHALVGENGAGKTTLMKILFGMEKPSEGDILYHGEPLKMSSSKDAISQGIGMVHQHFMLVDSFSVAQNIILGMEPKKGLFVNEEQAVSYTEQLCAQYNLPVDAKATTKYLPVGMKQKVEILKALARGAKILILDEPTAVLTPQETEQLFTELVHLKEQGHTIIFISHKIPEVKKISDRITVMRAGQSIGCYQTAEVSEQEISNLIVGWEMDTSLKKAQPKKSELKIKVSDVSYQDKEQVTVLNHVSFGVPGGMIFGIAGVQGNGQVELIELLTKRLQLQQGSISINGRSVVDMSVNSLRKSGLGYIPEDRMKEGIAKDISIAENIISNVYATPEFCRGGLLKGKEIAEYTDGYIEAYEIKCSGRDHKTGMLSGGNMQKVVAARECSHDPEVLIAEQPTRGVDIGAAHIIHKKIVELRDNGCAVLLVSADLSEVMKLSDVIAVMYEGEIVAYYDDVKKIDEEELGLFMLGVKKHEKEQIGRAANE